ncbi:methyltransferase, partial [Sinorhizobium medicae]|uniref:methyltransferase n=1 Tax=Sinorhizobium medicae TaxID=110321 RepID=UPI0012FBDCD2
MLNGDERSALTALRSVVDREGISNLLSVYGVDTARWRQLAFDVLVLPEPLAGFLAFFTQGGALEPSQAHAVFGDATHVLQALGIFLETHNGITLGRLRLVWHLGCLVLCDRPGPKVTRYHGEDSFALARQILSISSPGRMLDLCCGVGSQGLLAARLGHIVHSVDIQEDVRKLYEVNAALNGLEDKMSFRCADLFDGVESIHFDLIAANPPLVPMPQGLSIGIISDGGADGLDVTARIAETAPQFMTANGHLILQGVSFGGPDGPQLAKVISPLISTAHEVQVFAIYREALADRGPFVEGVNGGVKTGHGAEQKSATVARMRPPGGRSPS